MQFGGMAMSDLKQETTLISWDQIGDLEKGRPNLGQMVPVSIYRMMQYSIRHVLTRKAGMDFADRTFFEAGKLVGEKFCKDFLNPDLNFDDFLTDLKRILIEQKIGVLRVEKVDFDRMEILLTVAEDLDCSGLPIIDKTVCDYDEGFIAGIMKAYTGKEFSVKEIDCWGTGDRVCRFLVNKAE